MEPMNYHVNAAKQAIQTVRNHFISGICTTGSNWPIQLWDQIIRLAIITLNILRTSHMDPSKSAYHQLHCHKYDWNAHTMTPSGTGRPFMDTLTIKPHGVQEAPMHDTADLPSTIAVTASSMSQQQEPTGHLTRSTSSYSTASSPNSRPNNMRPRYTMI